MKNAFCHSKPKKKGELLHVSFKQQNKEETDKVELSEEL
jgi:hypothetical protein